ncbi:type IV inositol polyphosphate 5-phosphatase 3-like [Miscanthus floridulus]|uniref:type IV inositol polyphosphate 5-phosphatase 3-like n=1 Tax=Miscanthus floridulus TaxID=154761 RepID=UPI003458FEFD
MASLAASPRAPRMADHEVTDRDTQMKAAPCRLRRQKSEILRAQYVDVRELRICAGTWNVGSICPPSDLDIQEWLDIDEPADIYVLGFQEIIPLEKGYMIGTEDTPTDTRPVAIWEHIIHETLNKCSDKSKFKCHSDSPPLRRFNPSDCVLAMDNELHNESNNDSDRELHLLHNAKSSNSARHLQPLDLAFGVNNCNGIKRKRLQYVRVISKQMGSISVSLTIHETHFCFVSCHLASGEKNGNELKRNTNVEEIHRRTVFNSVHMVGVPRRIHDHERIILLGDLNYRLNLSYETTHELISKQDWDGLLKMDQLKKELGKGCTFDGWVEGPIIFPTTYKYEFNSEKYVSDETKSGRRTPAWCNNILSYGKGTKLLSYKRAELGPLSDHRPVTVVYMAEVEVVCRRRLQRGLTFSNADVEDHLLSRKEAHLEPKNHCTMSHTISYFKFQPR